MSALGRDIGKSLILVGGMGYFALLAIALIWLQMPPDVVLVMTVGVVAVGVMTLKPLIGIHALLALLYVENAVVTDEGLTGMKVLGVIIFTGWFMSMALQRKMPLRFDSLTVLALLFVTWTGISLMYAIYADPAVSRLFTFAQLSAATLMVSSLVDTSAKIRGIYWGIVIWTFLSTVIALAWYYMGSTPYAVGLMGNRNALAGAINLAIVCAYMLHQVTSTRAARLFLSCTLPVFIFGMALTFSRMGMIMLLVALLCVWYRVIIEKRLLVLIGSMIIVCIISIMVPTAFWLRAGTILPAIERQEGTFGMRIELWKVAWKMIQDRPVTGVGPGNFAPAFARYARGEMMTKTLDAHNSYLSVASQMGVVGLGLFLLLHLAALRQAFRATRFGRETRNKEVELFALALIINLALLMTGSMTGSSETNKSLWIFFGLTASLGRMIQSRAPGAGHPVRGGFQGERPEGSVAWGTTPAR